MLPIAYNELIQVVRNRSVLISMLFPATAAAFFIYTRDSFEGDGGLGYIAALLVFTVASFTFYTTVVTTLAARRSTLFLKRLRSTAASDPGILAGLILPVGVTSVLQVTVLLGVFAAVGERPADPAWVVVAVVAAFVMLLALALATAGVTKSPEHAQVTTLPLALGTIAVASWIGIAGTDSLTWVKRIVPGGSASELVVGAWNGGLATGDALLLLVPTLGWVAVSVVLAARFFSWEPRR